MSAADKPLPESFDRIAGAVPASDASPFETVQPVREGFVDRDGVRIRYAVWGESGPWIAFAPPFQIVHSQKLKGTVPHLSQHFRELRLILVTGPRLSPDAFEPQPGLEVRPCVHNRCEHLACCDLALVQGSLSTTMELVATRRPFLSFPLQRHFEQCVHMRQRLANYAADRSMDHAATLDPEHRGERCSSSCATGRWKPRRGARWIAHRAVCGEPRMGTMTPHAVSTCRFDARR